MKFYKVILVLCGIIAPQLVSAFAPSSNALDRIPNPCASFVPSQQTGTVLKAPFNLSWKCDGSAFGYWVVLKRGNEIYFSGPIARDDMDGNQGVMSIPNTSLIKVPPKDGKALEVQLWYQIGITGDPRVDWDKVSFNYVTEGGVSSMVITPTASSTLPSGSQLFSWTTIQGATEYWVDAGTGKGKADIYSGMSADNGVSPRVTISKIPQNGRPFFIRVWYHIGQTDQNWLYQDFFYNTKAPVTVSTISSITPAPGDSISTTQTFTWNAVTGVKQYGIEASQVSPGGAELAYKTVTNPTVTLSNINTGKNLYLRIWYPVNGLWKSQDFTYYK